MNDIFKRFAFFNIFFLCTFCCLFMVIGLRSFADNINHSVYWYNGVNSNTELSLHFSADSNYRYALYFRITSSYNGVPIGDGRLLSNNNENFSATYYNGSSSQLLTFTGSSDSTQGVYSFTSFGFSFSNCKFRGDNVLVFTDYDEAINYIVNGTIPELPFDDTLELDSLKVTSWQLGTSQIWFKSRFEVTWSDPNITFVQVIVEGPAKKDSFESSVSPFKQKFEPNTYVMKKGDVVHITATPYRSDGSYGVSLYQSFIFDDNIPGSNIYRKFTNTPYSDNTLTIPYTGVSGQPQSVTAPVDGITTNNTYKVNYNPVTYEYGDLNLYEVYYSPVIIYPSDTPTEEIDETQDVINNTYTTNNYYETTKNINIDFDVSFGDISGSDIQHGFDDFGNFSNGFGGFIAKLSTWVLALFPFLSPVVSIAIVFMFGLIVLLAIIALVLKIASVIADLILF